MTHVQLIVDGVVFEQSRVDGQSVVAGLCGPGGAPGMRAAILGSRHITSAIALRESLIESLPVAEFHRLRRIDQACSVWLQNMQARESRDELRRLHLWIAADCHERLDQLLVELVALSGEDRADGSLKLTVPLGVEKLAHLAAVRRETASRHLGRRMKDDTLRRHNGWFFVPPASDLMPRVRAERARMLVY